MFSDGQKVPPKPNRCPANVAHTRQSRPNYGLGFHVKVSQNLFSCSLLARKRKPPRQEERLLSRPPLVPLPPTLPSFPLVSQDIAVEPSSGSIVIPRRASPGLAGLRPHTLCFDFALRLRNSKQQPRIFDAAEELWQCVSGLITSERCRGTLLIRNRLPLGPFRRPMPRVVGGSLGGWAFSHGLGTPVQPPCVTELCSVQRQPSLSLEWHWGQI